ncbi:DUF760 domain-containing protein [Spirulina sp. CS-785/01]|uniref:DUF760 domain-containing protein n=1 Tax=Spirulina sp. CS-785/01 TaxID=3021716 RepID=UPI003FA68E4E
MNNFSHNLDTSQDANQEQGQLWQYVQSLDPELIAQLSQPSPDVAQAMERNIIGLLGGLPPEQFGVTISTSREHLGRLLASAMMSGYFLHSAEQRMQFEKHLAGVDSEDDDEL